MALTHEQAFKVGFLTRCADEGLTPEETHQRVKQALHALQENPQLLKQAGISDAIGKILGEGVELGGRALNAVPGLLSTGLAFGIGVPAVAGAGTGYIAGKLTSDDHETVEQAKQDELMSEYERLAEEARRRTRIKRLQALTGRKVVSLSPRIG